VPVLGLRQAVLVELVEVVQQEQLAVLATHLSCL
jgi:hypothetical protein